MLVLELLINFIVVALLAVTIFYCWILNKRIRVLQDSGSELAGLLRHFDESTSKAAESIMALQVASKKIGETIQSRIEKANYIADDLSFLIERGGRLTGDINPAAPRAGAIASTTDAAEAEVAVRKARAAAAREEPAGAPARPRGVSALQNMLEKLSQRATSDPVLRGQRAAARAEAAPAADDKKARSRTEQELLEMIRINSKV